LYAEIGLLSLRGGFQNEEDGWQLIGGMQQSFSQKLSNIKTAQQVGERLLMPPVRASLRVLRRMQELADDGPLYTKLYTEELRPSETYNDRNAPFVRAQTISPDLAYKLGYDNISELVSGIQARGIDLLTFSTVHSIRPAQDSPSEYLESWQGWLPRLIAEGKIGEIAVSFGRKDLKPRDNAILGATFDQAREILSGNPDDSRLGELPTMLSAVRTATQQLPEADLPRITLHAPISAMEGVAPARMTPYEMHRTLGEFVADRLDLSPV
jgi:hypothetical protein